MFKTDEIRRYISFRPEDPQSEEISGRDGGTMGTEDPKGNSDA